MAQESDEIGLIEKLDQGLADYYQKRGRKNYYSNGDGIFTIFCNDNGFEDDDVKEELQETDGNESTLTDFDDKHFPFDKTFDDDNDKYDEVLRILKYIAENGSYPLPPTDVAKDPLYKGYKYKVKKIPLTAKMCADITQQDIDKAVEKYSQMEQCLGPYLKKDENLKFFFAVSEKCQYPFLTYMVDSYTKDKAIYFKKTKQQLKIKAWAKDNAYMKELRKKYPQIAQNLESAIRNYGIRIMKRLQFTPTYKIKDDLKEICEYIAAIPAFINQLMDELNGGAPFQVDLYFAVKGVTHQVQQDDDDDEEKKNPKDDHIGDVVDSFENFPVAFFYRENKETPIKRDLGQRWANFRTQLSEFNDKHSDDDDSKDNKIKWDPKTYPQNRRFGILVDRRGNQEDNKEDTQDLITFFQHPKNCNKIQAKRVPEIGFELLQKCLIPRRGNNKINNITSTTDVCGQLLTFMFNVEEKHEIRCYIVWNGQTMRFEGENIINVLPYLFEESKDNIKFISEPEPMQTIKQTFVTQTKDAKYAGFCQALNQFV